MALIVQKYGGTSVGTVERIQAVAQRVQKTVRDGHSVVVVVSAMGKTTDTLVNLAQAISPNPSRREMDMLLSTGDIRSIYPTELRTQEFTSTQHWAFKCPLATTKFAYRLDTKCNKCLFITLRVGG
jgi:aspartokinase